jgi:hypothetical protein
LTCFSFIHYADVFVLSFFLFIDVLSNCLIALNLETELFALLFGRCVVCLAEYEDKDMLRFLPYCGHNFHMACIDLWLEQNSTCPVCRISLLGNLDNTHIASPHPAIIVVSPPCSPQATGSDPCRCLFVCTGHSSRASEVPRHEPDQENQVASGPSMDGAANNLPPTEVNSPRENSSQPVRKQVGRSTQLEPGK